MEEILVKKLREDAVVPAIATCGSAGADVRACLYDEETQEKITKIVVPVGGKVKIGTGLAFQSEGVYELILRKSNLPINLFSRCMVGKDDEIIFMLENIGEDKLIINNNDVIGRFILVQII